MEERKDKPEKFVNLQPQSNDSDLSYKILQIMGSVAGGMEIIAKAMEPIVAKLVQKIREDVEFRLQKQRELEEFRIQKQRELEENRLRQQRELEEFKVQKQKELFEMQKLAKIELARLRLEYQIKKRQMENASTIVRLFFAIGLLFVLFIVFPTYWDIAPEVEQAYPYIAGALVLVLIYSEILKFIKTSGKLIIKGFSLAYRLFKGNGT